MHISRSTFGLILLSCLTGCGKTASQKTEKKTAGNVDDIHFWISSQDLGELAGWVSRLKSRCNRSGVGLAFSRKNICSR